MGEREIIYLSPQEMGGEGDYIPIVTRDGGRGSLYTYRHKRWGEREIIYLSPQEMGGEGDYIPIATRDGGRGRLYTCRHKRWGEREIIYLSPHCHHQNYSCIKLGSDESRFNVSLTLRDKVARQCPQTTMLLKRNES